MSRVQELHVGNLLTVVGTIPGAAESFVLPGRDLLPTTLGIGAASVPGSIYANGNVLIGNPTAFPLQEGALMVARPNIAVNPIGAKCISLLKVTNKGMPPSPPTPLDVMLGDPGVGMVGITINSMTINIIESVAINIASPTINIAGVKNQAGAQNDVGAQSETGAKSQAGFKARMGASCDAGIRKTSPAANINFISGVTFTGYSQRNKPFDISHPKEKGKRIRHICAEGPEAGIYIRGKLKGTHIIDIPEYWQGLVDYDTITVNLTPCGKPDLSLYVKEIREDKIILSSDHLTQVECFYQVWVARWINPDNHDEKLHVVYEGESPADYPEDNSHYTMGVH